MNELVKTVELCSDQEKDVLVYPSQMAVSVRKQSGPSSLPASNTRVLRRTPVCIIFPHICFTALCFFHVFTACAHSERLHLPTCLLNSASVCSYQLSKYTCYLQKRPRDSTNNPIPQKRMQGTLDVSGTKSAERNIVDEYLSTLEKLKKKQEQIKELESRLASAKKTEGEQSLKPLTDRWRKAIILCLNAFHDHEQCPIDPETGERVSVQYLAQNLVGELEFLGITADDLNQE